MKNMMVILSMCIFTTCACAQFNPPNIFPDPNTCTGYFLMQEFLHSANYHPDIFTTQVRPSRNSTVYNAQFNQLLDINRKKEFYPSLLFDSRFVARDIPMKYRSPNYLWVSAQPAHRGFKEELTNNVISSLLNSKKHHFTVNNGQGYYTEAGIKY